METTADVNRATRLTQLINERPLGPQTPISVSTAMIFDNENVDFSKWEPYLYVNIRTLYRNFANAIKAQNILEMDAGVLYPKFMEEIEIFEEYLQKYTNGKVEPVFYFPDYRTLNKLLPQAGLRTIKTDQQTKLYDIEQSVYRVMTSKVEEERKLAKKEKREFEAPYIETGPSLPRGKGPALILTHVPSDLLSYTSFPVLKLIESHTGTIKTRDEWNTKLTGNPERLANIPFNRFTLQICGDGNHLVMSGTKKMKDYLFSLADKNNWTTMTTVDRIRFCINLIKSKQDRDVLLSWI